MKKNKTLKALIKKVIQDIFLSGKLNEKKAEGYLKTFKKLPNHEALEVLKEFERQLKRKMAETTLTIESAHKLAPVEIKKIEKTLKKEWTIDNVQLTINPNLIGGLKIKIGDTVFDDSLSRKILQVKEVITG